MYKSQVKSQVKKAEQTIFSGEPDAEELRAAISLLDKAAVKGIIHKNNAARRKSRLMKKYNAASAAA
jgi:small subunit ribosomal protein S20